MKYRKFGRLDWEVSALGFGTGRLPLTEKSRVGIDETASIGMLRYAIDSGVNYINLDCPAHRAQRKRLAGIVGRGLREGYRNRVKIAACLPSSLMDSSPDFDRYLDEVTGWLRVDRLDFFAFGGLDRETWPVLRGLNLFPRAEKAMADGRIEKLGFAFRDDYQTLRAILDGYGNWSFVQFPFSFMDSDHRPGIGGLNLAASRGLAVVVTEPLKGGRLTRNIPESIARIWTEATPQRPPAEWGLRWVWDNPEVSTVVSDMSSIAQLAQNLALADEATAETLTVPEQVLISRVREAYRKLRPIPCTGCRSCIPCPRDIDAPRIFELYNDAVMYGDVATARSLYQLEKHNIDNCDECNDCARACGRHIPIPDKLKIAQGLLGGK
ncbi:MAG: hypothetical protein A2Z29_06690 [Chloroflexi bacterium RBG_16_56_11]|nr:MAG: hypothetical protein A2Z29_06690 [Chloroflexi bacterium RBG_16_56_11]